MNDSDPNEPTAAPQRPGGEEPGGDEPPSSLPSWAVQLPEDAPAPLSPEPPSAGNYEPSTEVMEAVPPLESPETPEPAAPEPATPEPAAPEPAAPEPAAPEPAAPSASEALAPSALGAPEPPMAPPPVPPPALPPVAQNPETLPASGSGGPGVAAKLTGLMPPGRPEIAIGAAFVAGFVLAQILRRLAR